MRLEKKKDSGLILGILPKYALIPIISILCFDYLVFWGSRVITSKLNHIDMSTALDEAIHLMPWTITIYYLAFVFWAVGIVVVARIDKRHFMNIYLAVMLSLTVSLCFFIFLPSTLQRPQIVGDGIFDIAMRGLYKIDAADNLFPSLHCLFSWICWIGVRRQQSIPKWYRIFSLVFAIMICISTVTTKQHVVADIAFGVALAEISYFVSSKVLRSR